VSDTPTSATPLPATPPSATLAHIDRWRDRLGLTLLAAMVSLPFLHSRHFDPIPSFWAEWWAYALGLAAAGVLLARSAAWHPARLPQAMLIPLIFCVAAVAQIAFRRVTFTEQALLQATILLWTALMMLLGRHARDRFGLDRLCDLLATALLAGALINAGIALMQWLVNTEFAYPWIFPRMGNNPYGNLGQRNHLNHQMWLGIASATYLQLRQRASFGFIWLGMMPLLLAATLTTSRTVFLYAALMPLLAWPLSRLSGDGNQDKPGRRWLTLTLPLLPVVVVLPWVIKTLVSWFAWLGLDASSFSPGLLVGSAGERLFQEISGTDIRLRLIAAAWHQFLAAPLFGNGIGSLPWGLFLANEQSTPDWAPGVAEHAHNLVLQLLAEFGLVAPLLAVVVLALWARRFLALRWRLQHVWIAAILGVAALHSLLEYPLWYGFFLGIVALVLGMADETTLDVDNGQRGALLVAAIVIGAIAPLAGLRQDYAILETTLNRRGSVANFHTTIADLMQLQRNSLLAPHVLVTLAVSMDANRQQLEDKIAVCTLAQRFAPSRHIVFKCGVLLALADREDEAETQIRRALAAFPTERAALEKELTNMAAQEPQLEPLRRFVQATAPPG